MTRSSGGRSSASPARDTAARSLACAGEVAAFDLALGAAAHHAASPALVGAMLVVTTLGGADAVMIVGVTVAVLLVLSRRVRLAIA